MKTPSSPRTNIIRRRFLGVFELHNNPETQLQGWRVNFARLGTVFAGGTVMAYMVASLAVYYWLHNMRGVTGVMWTDVMLFRKEKIRHEIGLAQISEARVHLKGNDPKAAFVALASALRNAPDSVDGRVLSADLYHAAGLTDRAVTLLEEGLERSPGNDLLTRRLFELLLATGREQKALKLLRGKFAHLLSGAGAVTARNFEVLAVLSTEGAESARRLLDVHPDLAKDPAAKPVVARVLWENRERAEAIKILSEYVAGSPDGHAAYAQLADYQEAAGMVADARRTAEKALARFPNEIAVHVMLLGTLTPTRADEYDRWRAEVEKFLRVHHERPEALSMLADLAGRKGWVEIARLMYETATSRMQESRLIAIYYSDALTRQKKFSEASRVLREVDQQTHDDARLSLVIWQKQAMVSSALGADEMVRESARRLAAALHNDPVRLEHFRQRFLKMGMTEAAAQMTASSETGKRAVAKKS